jgi:hypothetical protein
VRQAGRTLLWAIASTVHLDINQLPRRHEVTREEAEKLHSEDEMGGACSTHAEIRNAHKIFIRKPDQKNTWKTEAQIQ